MLPEIRQTDFLYKFPKFELNRNDALGLSKNLKWFQEVKAKSGVFLETRILGYVGSRFDYSKSWANI